MIGGLCKKARRRLQWLHDEAGKLSAEYDHTQFNSYYFRALLVLKTAVRVK